MCLHIEIDRVCVYVRLSTRGKVNESLYFGNFQLVETTTVESYQPSYKKMMYLSERNLCLRHDSVTLGALIQHVLNASIVCP